MKVIRLWVVFLFFLVVGPFSFALTFEESKHILSRTGFSPSFQEVDAISLMSKTDVVNSIVGSAKQPDLLQVPESITAFPSPPKKTASDAEKKSFRRSQNKKVFELQSWWMAQMINTQTPFAEQMTLFWHNHFVSSVQKVKSPQLMYQQNKLFRDNATGSFKQLVFNIVKDPAMVIYLDSQSNKKDKPNENFARELLELFTLGEGNYSEQDIKESAKAFTGMQVDRRNGEVIFSMRKHDTSEKIFFGETGTFDSDDIVDLIFDKKGNQVAQYITEKLWENFVSSELDDAEIQQLAKLFVESNYELEPLLIAMFNTEAFWSEVNYNSLIKSPIDLVVGTQRIFGLELTQPSIVRQMGQNMGQMLFAPPNVKGWPGGEQWITSTTLLARVQMMGQVTQALENTMIDDSKMSMTDRYAHITKYSLTQWRDLLWGQKLNQIDDDLSDISIAEDSRSQLQVYDEELTLMLQHAAYQLK